MKKKIFLIFLLLLLNINVYARKQTKTEISMVIQECEETGVVTNSAIVTCPNCKQACVFKQYYMGQYPDLKNYPNVLGDWAVSIVFCNYCKYLKVEEAIIANSYAKKHPPKDFRVQKSNLVKNAIMYIQTLYDGKF